MVFDQIDKLKREYTDKYVVVDAGRPDLARFRGITGRIKTINMSGRALVEFDAYNNIGWYDIALDFLKVVDQPPPKPAESHEKPAKQEAPAAGAKVAAPKAAAPAGEKKLSPIEMARAQGAAKKPGEAPKQSTADILAAARGKAAAAAPVAKAAPPAAKAAPPAVKDAPAEAKKPAAPAPKPAASTGKLSTADILAAARANKAAAAAPKAAAPAPAAPAVVEEAPEPVAEPEVAPEPVAAVEKPAAVKSSGAKPRGTAEILAWCREHDAK